MMLQASVCKNHASSFASRSGSIATSNYPNPTVQTRPGTTMPRPPNEVSGGVFVALDGTRGARQQASFLDRIARRQPVSARLVSPLAPQAYYGVIATPEERRRRPLAAPVL